MKKRTIVGLVAIVTVVMLAGCIDKTVPTAPTPMPTPTNDDEAFLYFCSEMLGPMTNQTGILLASMNETKWNRERIIVDAGNLETLAETFLKECEEFQVSKEIQPLWITVRNMLDEIRLGSSDFKRGAKNRNIARTMEGFDHFGNASKYAYGADELIKNL